MADVSPTPAQSVRKGARRLRDTAFVRAWVHFDADGMTHHAAALAYYAMLSMLPGLLLGVSLLAFFGDASVATRAADYVTRHGADSVTAKAIHNVLLSVTDRASAGVASATVVASLTIALNGASGAFGAAGRALNVVNRVEEGRSIVHRKIVDIAATAAVILLFSIALTSVFLGGEVADDLLRQIGLGGSGAAIWSVLRWPLALAATLTAYAVVYTFSPNTAERRFRMVTAGSVAGVAMWIGGSIGFGIYVRHVPNYGAAYGTIGAAILLLLWLWLSANALLYGAELNAELDRRRTAPTGPPFPMPPPTPERPVPTVVDDGRS